VIAIGWRVLNEFAGVYVPAFGWSASANAYRPASAGVSSSTIENAPSAKDPGGGKQPTVTSRSEPTERQPLSLQYELPLPADETCTVSLPPAGVACPPSRTR